MPKVNILVYLNDILGDEKAVLSICIKDYDKSSEELYLKLLNHPGSIKVSNGRQIKYLSQVRTEDGLGRAIIDFTEDDTLEETFKVIVDETIYDAGILSYQQNRVFQKIESVSSEEFRPNTEESKKKQTQKVLESQTIDSTLVNRVRGILGNKEDK